MELKQHCGTDERRQKVLASAKLIDGLHLNGIDYLEVLDDDAPTETLRQRLIDVTFLKDDGVAALAKENFAIEGGVRIRGIKITGAAPGGDAKTVQLTLDKAGDFSRYTLRLRDGASEDPPAHIDPVLARVEFSFKADCPTDFDCLPQQKGPEEPVKGPAIDYLAKDYESFRRLMLDRMAVTIPAWTERSPADLGVTLVETLAYGADMASYYQDAVATEAYLSRARLRASARRHVRLLGYGVGEGCNARTFVVIDAAQNAARTDPPLLPKGTLVLTRPAADKGFGTLDPGLAPDPGRIGELLRSGVRVFETMEPVTRLRTAQNGLRFHSWSGANCCLPKGTTVAHLVGTLADTMLAAGDVLILEELIPLGGTADDPADPAHRQAVRLIETPLEIVDPVDDTPVLEIRWHLADALAFPLNLSGDGVKPAALARGNIVLADDGRTFDYVFANTADPAVAANSLHADLIGRNGIKPDIVPDKGRFRPALTIAPVTRAVPYDPLTARLKPARDALLQLPAEALPAIQLEGSGETWEARADLLLSDRFAAEFVVETRNNGGADLRFGDGRFGKGPVPGARYLTRLRTGNGPAGRIGAGALGHVVTDDPDLIAAVTNPLPATGGAERETLTAIKLAAPRAFKQQRRAVTAEDYAAFAEKHPDVQRAVAERRWTGSWHTMFIAVDRAGGREVDLDFEAEMVAFLEPFRLAGHDIEIEPPAFVPLDIQLVACVAPGHYAEHVEEALMIHFGSGIRPDGTLGFFHPDNFTFGQPVLLSPIIAAAMAIPGVRWIGMAIDGFPETGRFRRLDDQGTDYAEDGIIPVDRREVARLDNDPNAPERGRLRFVMEGGR